ncbi:hypothetical protein JF50_18435 [Pseudoalteromonas luteoviolacea]|uniref:6-bladed beta-propeller n=1 Tax=Pseudoalteromonas luteoviolacea TaxID=43657 RepID=A0A0C1Q6H7_9GAMM|nr:hypothetical protein [Pseudoalteromonas luteoviolacea]KID56241.1 hypothetical protein JF50_18435 [Pseudoalteromonas luteoviolacea]
MKRRGFVKSTLIMSALGGAGISLPILANQSKLTTSYTHRLNDSDLLSSNINSPALLIENPQQTIVEISLKPRVARRYGNKVYILFESTNQIEIYDDKGKKVGFVPLNMHVKDFAIDEKRQRLFVTGETSYSIYALNFKGEILGSFGEFGTELEHQLNGVKSITCDESGYVHVLNSDSNNIKLYDSQGVYVKSYGPRNLYTKTRLSTIDGYHSITVLGGKFADTVYKFDISGRPLG